LALLPPPPPTPWLQLAKLNIAKQAKTSIAIRTVLKTPFSLPLKGLFNSFINIKFSLSYFFSQTIQNGYTLKARTLWRMHVSHLVYLLVLLDNGGQRYALTCPCFKPKSNNI
jgi:hypothetical protein